MSIAADTKISMKHGDRVLETTMDALEAAAKGIGQQAINGMVRRSPDVQLVARSLIARFPDTFSHLDGWSGVWALDLKPPKRGCGSVAWVKTAPALWHDLYGVDFVVAVSFSFWEGVDDLRRRAALYHALCHLWTETDGEGEAVALRKADHDVAAFLGEVANFGSWRREIGALAEQLQMFTDSTS